MCHYATFYERGFLYFLSFSPFFGGPTGSKSFFEVVSILGPQKTGITIFFFIFSQTMCLGITQGWAPQIFVAQLDQMMLHFPCSRQRRPKNDVFILKSSNSRFHRGTANFIARKRKTSRRFKELDPEILHECSMGNYATFEGRGFFTFWFFYRFSGVPVFFGETSTQSDPRKTVKKKKTRSSKVA